MELITDFLFNVFFAILSPISLFTLPLTLFFGLLYVRLREKHAPDNVDSHVTVALAFLYTYFGVMSLITIVMMLAGKSISNFGPS